MAKIQIRYIVNDIDASIDFYINQLGFKLDIHPSPAFAMLSFNDLRLVLSAPNLSTGGGQDMSDGSRQSPGGWNRFGIEVKNLVNMVEILANRGVRFRSNIITGVGVKQIIIEDPSGNPVELFETLLPEARLAVDADPDKPDN